MIERLWSGERVTFHGRHVTVDDARLTLLPAQRPRPPVWIGANASEAAVRRAARLADAWIVSAHPDIDAVARHVATYRQALEELGKPFPAELPVLRNAYVAPDMDTALAEARGYFEASTRSSATGGCSRASCARAPASSAAPTCGAGAWSSAAPRTASSRSRRTASRCPSAA